MRMLLTQQFPSRNPLAQECKATGSAAWLEKSQIGNNLSALQNV